MSKDLDFGIAESRLFQQVWRVWASCQQLPPEDVAQSERTKTESPSAATTGRPNGNQQAKAPWQGKVNRVTAGTATKATNVVFGTFLVNSQPATVFFDTGAAHSFITSYILRNTIYT